MGLYAPASAPVVGSYAASINGLTLGPGTPYKLVGLVGWYDASPAPLGGSGQLAPKTQANGSWALPYYTPSRVVSLLIAVEAPVADGSFANAVSGLAQATAPQVDANGQPVQIPVTVQLGDPQQQTAYGSVSSRLIPTLAPDFSNGVSLATVEVTCPDPRKFGADVTDYTGLPSVSGGLTVPFTVPFALTGTQSSGSMVLTNPGDANGPVKLRIDGPCVSPSVTHTESGSTLTLATNLTVNAGDWLDIDCEARTVLYNGQASRNGYLTSRGWFAFEPGPNTIGFNASAYNSTARLTATCTPAWI
jgi:hypothetical protein